MRFRSIGFYVGVGVVEGRANPKGPSSRRWLVALAMLLACGTDQSGAGAGADDPVPDIPGPSGEVAEDDFPSVAADLWCSYLAACDGLSESEPSVDSCTDYWLDRFGSYAERSRAMGLTYDASCVGTFSRELQARNCGESQTWYLDDEFRCRCDVYFGTLSEGDPCVPVGIDGFDPCAKNLRCDGTCVSSCRDNVLGPGASCDPTGADGRMCAPWVSLCLDGVCVELPGAGEPCFRSQCNADEAWCDSGSGLCVANLSRGEACEDARTCQTKSCEGGACSPTTPPWPF